MNPKIAERIGLLRQQLGMPQNQLADAVGVTKQAISNYEKGIRTPDFEILEYLADALHTTLGYLIGATNDPNPLPPPDYEKSAPTLPSNVRPISGLHHQRIPLIGGAAAGEPIYDPEELGVYVDSPVEADAAITVRGDSMAPTYLDGDLVYIKCCPDVPEGAVAVVFLDDEATIKHVYKRPTGLTLIGDNRASPPIMAEFEDYANVRVFGVPVGYTRIYKSRAKIKKGF